MCLFEGRFLNYWSVRRKRVNCMSKLLPRHSKVQGKRKRIPSKINANQTTFSRYSLQYFTKNSVESPFMWKVYKKKYFAQKTGTIIVNSPPFKTRNTPMFCIINNKSTQLELKGKGLPQNKIFQQKGKKKNISHYINSGIHNCIICSQT